MRPSTPALALAALLLSGLPACSRPSQPNVLLIVVDTLRADHLGSYGYSRPTSPNLDALATRGVRFSRAHATSSWTAPSVTSILTGMYPAVHGVEKASSVLGTSVPTMAEAFRAAGYATGAISSNPVFVSPRVGLQRGFDSFDVLQGPPVGADQPVKRMPTDAGFQSFVAVATADVVTNAAMDWLKKHDDKPWFLYLHYIDPHADYFPPTEFAARFGVAVGSRLAGVEQRPLLRTFRQPPSAEDLTTLIGLYDGEIAFTDAHLGRLLDAIASRGRDDTLVVVTADHGEEFGDHGRMLHSMTLFEEVLHVPLILAGVGLPRARVVETPVSLVSLWATIAELVKVAGAAPGSSFAAITRGAEVRGAPIYADLDEVVAAIPHIHSHAVLDGSSKLITSVEGAPLLFDLATDAKERDDVAVTEEPLAQSLLHQLRTRAAVDAKARDQTEPGTVELSPEDRARMRALGYGD